MATWFDHDQPYTPQELATILKVDIRFFRIAAQAGLTTDRFGKLTTRSLWLWWGIHYTDFRRASGMRSLVEKTSLKGRAKEVARFENAILTLAEFFGILPFEHAVYNAVEILRPSRRKNAGLKSYW